ncbi:MAG: hypothetical protein ACRYGK_17765 [Janthinobacterium lividum]
MRKPDCTRSDTGAGTRTAVRSQAFIARTLLSLAVLGAALAGASGTVHAQQTEEQRYRAEVAACNNGSSNQDRATCLKEAGAARDEAGKNHLSDGRGELRSNAVDRCKALPAGDQDACMQRIEGQGSTEGSVGSGGILRELVVPDAPK